MANEKRLIDANALYQRLNERANDYDLLDECTEQVIRDDMEIVQEQPTLDAVEVVRCKYCIRRYDTDECPMCYLSGGQYVEDTSDDSYCSRGAKMDGGEKSE